MDNLDLQNLIASCRNVESAKVKEREKLLETIDELLHKARVVNCLDRNTDDKKADPSRKLFGWDNVFTFVGNLVWSEREGLKKLKSFDTAVASKRRHFTSSLFKYIVRTADKRGKTRLKSPNVVKHVLAVMKDDFCRECFGSDHTSVLFKDILCVRKYWPQLKREHWQELLVKYSDFLRNSPAGLDRVLISRILHTVIRASAFQYDVRAADIVPSFTAFFANIKNENSAAVVEHMVGGMSALCSSVAISSRSQVCRLGEEVIMPMLFMWNHRASDKLKDEIVDFLLLQLHVHHPRGQNSEAQGAHARSWDTWKSLLRKIYELIYNEIQDMCGRSKFAKGVRETGTHQMKDNIVTLGADVCHQVFYESSGSSIVEVTCMDVTEHAPAAKKRKLESGWRLLRERLTGKPLVPWLQLAASLLQRYPASVPDEDVVALLQTLQQLLPECRKPDTTQWTLKVLSALCVSQQTLMNQQALTEFSLETCQTLWKKVAAATIRLLSFHHAEHEGYALLAELLHMGIPLDIWSLYLPILSTPSLPSLTFLSHHLHALPLPQSKPKHKIRHQLVDWLLPVQDELTDTPAEGATSVTVVNADDVVKSELQQEDTKAEVIVSMLMRDTTKIRLIDEDVNEESRMQVIEGVYLWLTKMDDVDEKGKNVENKVEEQRMVKEMWDKVQEMIASETSMFLDLEEITGVCLRMCLHHCYFVQRFLITLFTTGLQTLEKIKRMQTFKRLQELLQKVTPTIRDLGKLEVPVATHVVSVVHEILKCHLPAGSDTLQQVAALTRTILPDSLASGFLKYLNEKSVPSRRPSVASVSTPVASLDLDMFDDDVNGNTSSRMDFDDMMDTTTMDTQESDEFTTTERSENSILSLSSLSPEDQLRLSVIRVLCIWLTGRPRTTLADHVDEEATGWKPTRAVDMIMLEELVTGLAKDTITEEDMETFLEAIRTICKEHRYEQEVCSLVLSCLCRLVPHLCNHGDQDVTDGTKDSRTIALRILGVFWKNCDHYCSDTRLQLSRCMCSFIQCDPECSWTIWKVRDAEGRGTHIEELRTEYPALVMDPSHHVRIHVAQTIKWLFVKTTSTGVVTPLPKQEQLQHFDNIHQKLQETLAPKSSRQPSDEMRDDRDNVTSSVLYTLATIAVWSPVCEKKAILTICTLAHKHNFETDLVKQVLGKVSTRLKFQSLSSFMKSHLTYLVQEWLSGGAKIQQFPWQLTGYRSLREFYREEQSSLVRFAVLQQDEDVMKALCGNEDIVVVLCSCLPLCLTHILPLFAAHKAGHTQLQREAKKADECYDWLLKKLKQEVIEKCIVNKLDEVVYNLLLTLNDKTTDQAYRKDGDPDPNPPSYNTEVIRSTLDYLKQGHDNASSLVNLLAKGQDSIQRILLWLTTSLRSTPREAEKRRVLLAYRLFVSLLLADFHHQLGGSWAYVLREVIYTLLHTMEENTSVLVVSLCVDILSSVCRVAVEACPEELGRFLPSVVSGLTSLTGDVAEQGEGLVRYLLVESAVELKQAIVLLDPVPFPDARRVQDKYKYAHGKFTVQQEVSHFLSAGAQYSGGQRLEGLHFLQEQIHEHGAKQLIQQDVTVSSPLPRLLYELFHLLGSSDLAVTSAAAECLGELGPIDLGLTALGSPAPAPALHAALQVYKDNSIYQAYCHLMHRLDAYLIHDNMDTVRASSEVLKSVLATKTGAAFATDYKQKVADHFFQYLHPFRSRTKKFPSVQREPSSIREFTEFTASLTGGVWTPCDYSHWVTRLAGKLITSGAVHDEILNLLNPICKVKSEFSELVLPYLFHDLLLHGEDTHRDILSTHVAAFLEQNHAATLSSSKECVGAVLKVVQYLRKQTRPSQARHGTSTAWDNNFWLDLNYLHMAKAAYSCGEYFSSLLYAEIWCYKQRDEEGSPSSSSQVCNQQFSENSQIRGHIASHVHDLILHAYRAIGDPDAVYSCGTNTQPSARVKMYEHEEKWAEALGTYDIELHTDSTMQIGLLQSLYNFGASHVMEKYLETIPQTSAVREFQYKMAATTGNWDMETTGRLGSDVCYHEAIYTGLLSVREHDAAMSQAAVDVARQAAIRGLTGRALCCRGLYPILAELHCVQNIQHFVTDPSSDFPQLPDNDYEFVEPILALRCALLDIAGGEHRVSRLRTQLQTWAKVARQAARFQVSERLVHRLSLLDPGREEWSWQVEEAHLFWSRREHDTAKRLLRGIIANLEQTSVSDEAANLFPQCLGVYGNWLAETQSENPSLIMEDYLSKAVELLEDSDGEEALDAFLSLARFADGQYRNMMEYMKSSTFESKCELVRQAKEDVSQLEEMRDQSRYKSILNKQRAIDEQEVLAYQKDCTTFLLCAVDNYLSCLQRGDRHNLRVFRLTALWFDNAAMEQINTSMKRCYNKIGSYKFLPLIYQLAARMSEENTQFQKTLNKVIERIVIEHPHHSLSVILALAHANKDQELLTMAKSNSRASKVKLGKQQQQQQQDESRVAAAKAMLERLRKGSAAQMLTDTERLSVAYIELANFNVEQYKKETKPINLPSSLMLRSIKALQTVAVPTMDLPIDVTGSYKDVTYIHGFQNTFKLAGGINLPKIISCVGSDGVSRRQLVKGRDDLRQDAVMQQVFALVNDLLQRDSECSKRRLNVRSYKVIPLSQRSGLLEWCEGTIPLGDYLIHPSNGAHQRYRPEDYKAHMCRKAMNEAHSKDKDSKLSTFLKVCRQFQPVFRHFFLERWPDPADWYERRTAYTRSVATNSIVGYILGLGDRHVQNILVDCDSAELVHIDLGVAFEQGRILPTPETVPFRLTRDIVDGMGVPGVEGSFRRCCEKTMAVMHANSEALLTILQVLLYDPLYAWTLSPEKACLLQQQRRGEADVSTAADTTSDMLMDLDQTRTNADTEPKNKVAERVLLRLQQKLAGMEDGQQLSLPGQVNHLIQTAKDPSNLSRLFPGWQPYV